MFLNSFGVLGKNCFKDSCFWQKIEEGWNLGGFWKFHTTIKIGHYLLKKIFFESGFLMTHEGLISISQRKVSQMCCNTEIMVHNPSQCDVWENLSGVGSQISPKIMFSWKMALIPNYLTLFYNTFFPKNWQKLEVYQKIAKKERNFKNL